MPPRASARVASTSASVASDTKSAAADAKDINPSSDTNNNNNNNDVKGDSASATGADDHDADADKNAESTAGDAEGAANARMRKRRLDVNPNLIISEERSKRRRTPSHEPEDRKPNGTKDDDAADPKDPERAKALGDELVKKILDTKDSE